MLRGEWYFVCPYDPTHCILEDRRLRHLSRCIKTYRANPHNNQEEFQVCEWNAGHRVPKSTYMDHLSICPEQLAAKHRHEEWQRYAISAAGIEWARLEQSRRDAEAHEQRQQAGCARWIASIEAKEAKERRQQTGCARWIASLEATEEKEEKEEMRVAR